MSYIVGAKKPRSAALICSKTPQEIILIENNLHQIEMPEYGSVCGYLWEESSSLKRLLMLLPPLQHQQQQPTTITTTASCTKRIFTQKALHKHSNRLSISFPWDFLLICLFFYWINWIAVELMWLHRHLNARRMISN